MDINNAYNFNPPKNSQSIYVAQMVPGMI